MLIAHGRNPYTGERKVVVTMGEMSVERREWERKKLRWGREKPSKGIVYLRSNGRAGDCSRKA